MDITTTPVLPPNALPVETTQAPTTQTIVRDVLCRAIVELERAVDLLEADDPATLREFLIMHIQCGDGQMFTDTILTCYAEWCVQQGRHGLPRPLAAKRLPRLMATLFGVSESHSLRRDGKPARGYHGLVDTPR